MPHSISIPHASPAAKHHRGVGRQIYKQVQPNSRASYDLKSARKSKALLQWVLSDYEVQKPKLHNQTAASQHCIISSRVLEDCLPSANGLIHQSRQERQAAISTLNRLAWLDTVDQPMSDITLIPRLGHPVSLYAMCSVSSAGTALTDDHAFGHTTRASETRSSKPLLDPR